MIEWLIRVAVAVLAIAIWEMVKRKKPLPAPPPPPRQASPSERKMMGADSPADQKVPVRVGDWNALRLAAWRSKTAFEITMHAAEEILGRCRHSEGCPGIGAERELCSRTCADRETRMDALVVLNAARMHIPVDARKPADDRYFAPTREYFSDVLSTLAATQLENDRLRAELEKCRPFTVETKEPPLLEAT